MSYKDKYKNRHPLCSTLDIEIYKKLDEYSALTKIPKTKILDMALEKYFESVNFNFNKKKY